jgi:hypothetical protein
MKPAPFLLIFLASVGLISHSLAQASDRTLCEIPNGQAISGDYKLPWWIPGDYVTFGPTASVQAVRYDFALKKAALSTGVGAGVSARIYNNVNIKGDGSFEFNNIKTECRRTTFDIGRGKDPGNPKIVGPTISITPIVYYSKTETSDFTLQPAVQLGFLEELINIGVGFNLTGQNQGHVFVLLSLGYGFRLDK